MSTKPGRTPNRVNRLISRLRVASCIVLGLFAIAVSSDACGQETSAGSKPSSVKLDPNLPYQATRTDPVTYEVELCVIATAPYKCKKLEVWIPVPTTDAGQEVLKSEFETFPIAQTPTVSSEPTYGNRFAYFVFDSPQGAQIIRHRFEIQVYELNWNVESSKVQQVDLWPESFAKYQASQPDTVAVDERFTELLDQITPATTSTANRFNEVIQWVEGNFQYDHADASLQASAEHGLLKKRGHCSDYHSFCASMGRALGVPTRVTYGINAFPKNSPSHCKLEAFLPPYGWVSFDVSETQKLTQLIRDDGTITEEKRQELTSLAQSRLMRGFRDNTWFLQTRGTDYELAPPASTKAKVIRTAFIQADGIPLAEPDPADSKQKSFTWMTAHRYTPDRTVPYPFNDWHTLETKKADTP